MEKRLFTSESVTEGHPDKMCDAISDAILDALMEKDPMSRVACETAITTGMVLVMGEITTNAYIDMQQVVRETIKEIGYDNGDYGFDAHTCAVLTASLMRGSTMRESVTDVRIILECLQEAYQMEGDMVRSGKNIHATMIYPFVRMLQEKCRDLTEEQIHKTLWKEYEISGVDRMFVERASKILEPYEGESEDEK